MRRGRPPSRGVRGGRRGYWALVLIVVVLSLAAILPPALRPAHWAAGGAGSPGARPPATMPQGKLAAGGGGDGAQLHARVSAQVLALLHRMQAKLDNGQQPQGGANDWFAQHAPAALAESVSAGGATFVAAPLGASCYDACRNASLACDRRWFDVLNDCEVLRTAFPAARACSTAFYGRDLPAYRGEDATALTNKLPRTWAASCGGKHEKTQRLCGCGPGGGGGGGGGGWHTVYNVQASRYFEWQVRYMHLWHAQAHMPGRITRLLSAAAPDHLAAEIPTHVAPPFVREGDHYPPYNKPASVADWLRRAPPAEDIVVIVDPDCMFVRPLDIVVQEGSPIAQSAFYSFDFEKDDVPMQVAGRYCPKCPFLDPIAVPIIIHRNDIAKIAPLWLKKTIEIRSDMHNWLSTWSNRTASPVGLAWTAEMFGYVFAAAELGIRHEIWELQVVPSVHTQVIAPIIHYHVEAPLPDGRVWYKHAEGAGEEVPWPLPAGTDEVTGTLITKLHEARERLGGTGHVWRGDLRDRYAAEVR